MRDVRHNVYTYWRISSTHTQKHTHLRTLTHTNTWLTPRSNKVTHQLEAQSRCRTGSWSHPGRQTSRWQNQPLCTGVQKWTSLPVEGEQTHIIHILTTLYTCYKTESVSGDFLTRIWEYLTPKKFKFCHTHLCDVIFFYQQRRRHTAECSCYSKNVKIVTRSYQDPKWIQKHYKSS